MQQSIPTTTRTITYAYDGVQRLISASENPGVTQALKYDLAGNRTGVWVNSTRSGVSGLGFGVLTQRSAPIRNATDTLYPRPTPSTGTLVAQTQRSVTTHSTQELAAPFRRC